MRVDTSYQEGSLPLPRHLHFDCFNGISGDMTLGALVDLGVPPEKIEQGLAALPIGPFKLRAEKIKRAGIVGTLVHVEVEEDPHPHAHLKHIVEKVRAANLSKIATERALAAYQLIAEAEAKVHGSTVEKIHFHEVGAKDAIVDIAGAMLGAEILAIDSFSCSTIAVGSGTVECAHGVMPVPAPATAEILSGLPTEPGPIPGELTTPTGAAIVRVLAGTSSALPPGFRSEKVGYGGGTRTYDRHPNYLRLMLGEVESSQSLPVERETIIQLEAEMDDMTGEVAGFVMEKLLAAGAKDVHFRSVQMKKNRPALSLSALCSEADSDRLAEIILKETTTFGVRKMRGERYCLPRRLERVATPFGEIEVKIAMWGDKVLKAKPEYESCKLLAEKSGRTLIEIQSAAIKAIEEKYFNER